MSTGEAPAGVALRFFLPPRRLRPFITTLYHMEISGAEDEPVVDWLHPEWANLRIIPDRNIEAALGGRSARANAAGPADRTDECHHAVPRCQW